MAWLSSTSVQILASQKTNAHRVLTSKEAIIDRFDKDYLISLRKGSSDVLQKRLMQWVDNQRLPLSRIYLRRQAPDALQTSSFQCVFGNTVSPPLTHAMENGLTYQIDFSTGHSPGLFVDQRENRRFLENLHPKHVLNLFAYTCAFSVAAARRGAQTLSIDVSKKWLNQGRKNFMLNKLSLENHRFYAEDTRTALPRLIRRHEKFDTIILDPPTFARTAKGTFRAERDYPILVDQCIDCLLSGGHLLLSTNYSSWTTKQLRQMAQESARRRKKIALFTDSPKLIDISEPERPATIWVRFASSRDMRSHEYACP